MRTSIALVLVAVGMLGAAALRAAPPLHAQATADWLPFTPGESVKLYVDLAEGMVPCKVTQVQNGFIGCGQDGRAVDRWINLRFVKEIVRR